MQTVFPHARSPKAEGDAATVRQLVAEAVDSLGELVADHTRLARLELAADVRIYARATGGVVVAALLLTAGYVLGFGRRGPRPGPVHGDAGSWHAMRWRA